MAYNAIDVTTGKGDVLNGPLFWYPGGFEGDVTLDLDLKTETGWIQIGEASTDGVEFSTEVDSEDKKVWGDKILGTIQTNYKETAVVNHASFTDKDVLGIMYNPENVVVADGVMKVVSKNRIPKVGTLVIQAVTDDDRKNWMVIPKAQPDLNLTFSWGDEEIIVVETTYNCLPLADKTCKYMLTETAEEDTPVEPEALVVEEDPEF